MIPHLRAANTKLLSNLKQNKIKIENEFCSKEKNNLHYKQKRICYIQILDKYFIGIYIYKVP